MLNELILHSAAHVNVVQHGRTLAKFPDAARWEAMHAAQQLYLHTLDDLELWDIQTARLKAIEFREIKTTQEIVLLGTVDLNRTRQGIRSGGFHRAGTSLGWLLVGPCPSRPARNRGRGAARLRSRPPALISVVPR